MTVLRVLVVDDEEPNVTSLRENLCFYFDRDYGIELAFDHKSRIEDALPTLEQSRDKYPLVITDLIFKVSGVMNTRGTEVIERAVGPNVVVVALTIGSLDLFPRLEAQARAAQVDVFRFRMELVGQGGRGWQELAAEIYQVLVQKGVLTGTALDKENAAKDLSAPIRGPVSARPVAPEPLDLLLSILRRFQRFALELSVRHGNRSTLTFSDEYDVQDALRSVLSLHFDDVRPEEPTPSHAGGGLRVDLLLKHERIFVEVKFHRGGTNRLTLRGELADDKESYRSHQDCSTLVFFVYDPDLSMRNVEAFEQDLSEERPGFRVRVVVAPRA